MTLINNIEITSFIEISTIKFRRQFNQKVYEFSNFRNLSALLKEKQDNVQI